MEGHLKLRLQSLSMEGHLKLRLQSLSMEGYNPFILTNKSRKVQVIVFLKQPSLRIICLQKFYRFMDEFSPIRLKLGNVMLQVFTLSLEKTKLRRTPSNTQGVPHHIGIDKV